MNVDSAMLLLDSLFPRAKWSDGMAAQFRDDCAILRLTDEQAEAVIREHRRNRNANTPQFKTLLESLRKAQFQSVAGVAPEPRQEPSGFCANERARRRTLDLPTFDGDNERLVIDYHARNWEDARRSEAETKLHKGYCQGQRLNYISQFRCDLIQHAGLGHADATHRALQVWNHWTTTVIGPTAMSAAEYADPFGYMAREKAEKKAKREAKSSPTPGAAK